MHYVAVLAIATTLPTRGDLGGVLTRLGVRFTIRVPGLASTMLLGTSK